MRAYIINLPEAIERWRWMQSQLETLPLSMDQFAAIRGTALRPEEAAYDEASAIARYRRPFSAAEVGCSLSHIKVYDRIAAGDEACALVFEDDAAISPILAVLLPGIDHWLRSDQPRVVLLTRLRRFAMRGAVPLTSGYRLVKVWNAWYAHGYALNRAAADRLRKKLLPVSYLPDDWRRFASELAIDVRGVDPYCVGHSAFAKDSAIGEKREELREGVQRSPAARLGRILYRIFIERMIATPILGLRKHEKTW
ncbi:MAG: glycosyltransferase family 25 protein [Burkholderiales bacterium]